MWDTLFFPPIQVSISFAFAGLEDGTGGEGATCSMRVACYSLRFTRGDCVGALPFFTFVVVITALACVTDGLKRRILSFV